MLYRKVIALFLLVFLAGWNPIANAEELFTHVKKDEPARFTGYLFTPEAITKIYTTCKEEVERKELECTADISSINLELSKTKELLTIDLTAKDNIIEKLTKLKNDEILARERIIQDFESERARNNIFLVGSFLAGALLTGTIVYLVSGVK